MASKGTAQDGSPGQEQPETSDTVSTSAGVAAGRTLACLAQIAGEPELDQGLDCLHCTLPPHGWKNIDKDDFDNKTSVYAAYEHVSRVLHGKIFPLLIKKQSGEILVWFPFPSPAPLFHITYGLPDPSQLFSCSSIPSVKRELIAASCRGMSTSRPMPASGYSLLRLGHGCLNADVTNARVSCWHPFSRLFHPRSNQHQPCSRVRFKGLV